MKLPWSKPKIQVAGLTPSPDFDLKLFKKLVEDIKCGNKVEKARLITQIHEISGMILHHTDKETKRKVLHNCSEFEFHHEHHAARKLTSVNYDVLFVPKGFFKRDDKKFDVFISRGHIFLEADLKSITSDNSDTIGNRIKEGSEQAKRVVLDIQSGIERRKLIEALKTGCERNSDIKEILLFFNSKFYSLPATQILSKRIFEVL